MNLPRLKQNERVEILWHDAHDAGTADKQWLTRDEVGSKPFDYECLSIGYFLKYDQDMIYIFGDIGGTDISRPFAIPRGCIKAVKRL